MVKKKNTHHTAALLPPYFPYENKSKSAEEKPVTESKIVEKLAKLSETEPKAPVEDVSLKSEGPPAPPESTEHVLKPAIPLDASGHPPSVVDQPVAPDTSLTTPTTLEPVVATVTTGDTNTSSKDWKYYLRLTFIVFIFSFLTIDLGITYLHNQSSKSVSPIVGASFSVVPQRKQAATNTKKEVIGFLPSWFVAKNVKVDVKKLTQIIYFGLAVNPDGQLVQYDEDKNPVTEWSYFNSDYFTNLQEEAKFSKTKILLSITNFDNTSIDHLVSNPQATKTLTTKVNEIIKDHKLDGININFEYVTDTDFPTAKYLNSFLDTFTKEIKKENPQAIISFDVNALAVEQDSAYDMVKIGELVDQVILMGYDYNRAASTRAGPVAPLNGTNEHSITKSLQSMVGRVPNEKVVLGLPFYGYEWQTVGTAHRSATVADTGAVASFKRVKDLLANRDDIKVEWDDNSQSPWFYYEQSGAIKQIYYEDAESLGKKLELVDTRSMPGIAIWALGYEGDTTDLWEVIGTWQTRPPPKS